MLQSLRPIQHRGVVSSAIVYDHLPIIEVLRQLDEDNLLSVMNLRSVDRPFFFRLARSAVS